MLLVAVFPDRRHLLQVWQYVFDHSRPDVVSHPTSGDIHHPDWGLGEVQFRQLAELVRELRAADDRMKKRRMNWVHGIF